MNYPGTTREIRFGDAVQIVSCSDREHRYLVGRITAQSTRSESEFHVRFGNNEELPFTTDQFQWVGSPRPQDQQELRSQIRSRERMD